MFKVSSTSSKFKRRTQAATVISTSSLLINALSGVDTVTRCGATVVSQILQVEIQAVSCQYSIFSAVEALAVTSWAFLTGQASLAANCQWLPLAVCDKAVEFHAATVIVLYIQNSSRSWFVQHGLASEHHLTTTCRATR